MSDLRPIERLKLLVHPLAAAAGVRNFRPLRLHRAGSVWVVESEGRRITVPSARRWQHYKRGLAARLEKLAAQYGVGPEATIEAGHTVVDIGANIGEFALYAAGRGARVFAIEPDPMIHECLAENTRDLVAVTRLKDLLWFEEADLSFNSAPADADSSIFAPDAGVTAQTLTIHARPVDQVLAPYAIERIDFLKCDAEGAEPEVLDGALQTLARTRFIAVDTGPERNGESTGEAVGERLAKLGFTVSQRGGVRPMTFGRRA